MLDLNVLVDGLEMLQIVSASVGALGMLAIAALLLRGLAD